MEPHNAACVDFLWNDIHAKACGCYISSFFMFLNFDQLDLHTETCIASANLRWGINQIQNENQPYSDLLMVIKNAWLLIS